MIQVEDLQTIVERYRAEGKRPMEATAEWQRQCREALRERESDILRAAELPRASAALLAVAEQINDHRAAGNYTTQG